MKIQDVKLQKYAEEDGKPAAKEKQPKAKAKAKAAAKEKSSADKEKQPKKSTAKEKAAAKAKTKESENGKQKLGVLYQTAEAFWGQTVPAMVPDVAQPPKKRARYNSQLPGRLPQGEDAAEDTQPPQGDSQAATEGQADPSITQPPQGDGAPEDTQPPQGDGAPAVLLPPQGKGAANSKSAGKGAGKGGKPPLDFRGKAAAKLGATANESTRAKRETLTNDSCQQAVLEASNTTRSKKAEKAAFERTLMPRGDDRTKIGAQVRQSRSDKCPEEIVLQMSDPAMKEHWFDKWLENNYSWNAVQASESFEDEKRNESGRTVAWLTFAQLSDVYKSATVANAIRAEKSRHPGNHKPHPEVPECVEAELFKCFLSETEIQTLVQSHKKKVESVADMDDAAGLRLLRHEAARLGFDPGQNSASASSVEARPVVEASPSASAPQLSENQTKARAEEEQEEKQKAAAQKKKDEEEEKKRKADAAKQKREDLKTNPIFQASRWISGVNSYIGQCHTLGSQANNAVKIDQGVRDVYCKKFE